MFEFLEKIVYWIGVLFDMLVNVFKAIAGVIALIPQFVLFISGSVASLPTIVISFIMLGVTCSVLLWIIGRKS